MRGTGIHARMRAAGWEEMANGLWYLPDPNGGSRHFALDGRDAVRAFLASAPSSDHSPDGSAKRILRWREINQEIAVLRARLNDLAAERDALWAQAHPDHPSQEPVPASSE